MLAITKEKMAELDRLMVERFGIEVLVMMEHAGIDIAEFAVRLLGNKRNVVILAGHGNNGGDGLCAARHLMNKGYSVKIFLASLKEKFSKEPLKQLMMLKNVGAEIRCIKENDDVDFSNADLIIDALLGYNLVGNPKGSFGYLIENANESGKDILAVDLPSGLDANSGVPRRPCIMAQWTLSLSYPKIGLLNEKAKPYVGDIYIGYISVPDSLYSILGLTKINFNKGNVVRLAEVEG